MHPVFKKMQTRPLTSFPSNHLEAIIKMHQYRAFIISKQATNTTHIISRYNMYFAQVYLPLFSNIKQLCTRYCHIIPSHIGVTHTRSYALQQRNLPAITGHRRYYWNTQTDSQFPSRTGGLSISDCAESCGKNHKICK